MATTKITTNSLADSAVTSEKLASSISIDNLSVSGNLTVDTDTLVVDSVNDRVGIGTTSPSASLHTISTTEQVRFGYDVSNYWNATTSSTGVTTLSAEGSGAKFVFANDVEFGANATIPDVIGDTSFADDVEVLGALTAPNQEMNPSTPKENVITKANYLAMHLFEANRVFEVHPASSGTRTDTGTGTTIGSYTYSNGIGAIRIGNYTTSTIRAVLAPTFWMYSSGSGATMSFAIPWAISFKFFNFLRDLNTVHRIYIGSNGSNSNFPIPLKDQDAYPSETRGIGIEIRRDPSNSYGTQCRIFARDGYSGEAGVFAFSDWEVLAPNSDVIGYAHHLILTNDGSGNIALFAKVWNGQSSAPNMTSRVPLLTLSGTGVPSDARGVFTNWGIIEMCMANNGVNPAAPTGNQLNMYPLKIQLGNLL